MIDLFNLIKPREKVLITFPHPDDESAFAGGFMQEAIRRDIDIKVITLTKGENSTLRYGLENNEDLATARSEELNRALRNLGTDKYMLMNFPDGSLDEDKENVREFLLKEIKNFKPKFVITFEPFGVYGHPDHIALSKITTSIYKSNQGLFRLIYATVGDTYKSTAGECSMCEQTDRPIKYNSSLQLTLPQTIRKTRALISHRSQFPLGIGFLHEWFYQKKLMFREYFHVVERELDSITEKI